MEVFFIGTSATAPSVKRGLPALAIRTDELLLFDVGEGTQRQMMIQGIKYGSISAIFISHEHLDHYLGLFGLLETLKLNNRTAKLHVFAPFSLPQLIKYDFVDFHLIDKESELYKTKEYSVYSFKTLHSDFSYGFVIKQKDKRRFYKEKAHEAGLRGKDFKVIEQQGFIQKNGKKIMYEDITYLAKGKKIIYTSDTRPMKKTIALAKQADLLIHEATFLSSFSSEAKERKHSTVEDAINIAKQADAKALALTHFSTRYSFNEIEEDVANIKKKLGYDKKIIAARDGLAMSI